MTPKWAYVRLEQRPRQRMRLRNHRPVFTRPNVPLRTRDRGSRRKGARPDPRSTLPQGLGALQTLHLGQHRSPRGRKFVRQALAVPARPTFLGSPNPLLSRFPTGDPQPGFPSGGGACTVGLGAGTHGPGPTAAPRPRRAHGLRGAGGPGAGGFGRTAGGGRVRVQGRGRDTSRPRGPRALTSVRSGRAARRRRRTP